MPAITWKRVLAAAVFAMAAVITVYFYLAGSVLGVLLGGVTGGAGMALLVLGVYRRTGYQIVLSNRQAGQLDQLRKSVDAIERKQNAISNTLRHAALHDMRSLVLDAFREAVELTERVDEKTAAVMERQQQNEEYLGRLEDLAITTNDRLGTLENSFQKLLKESFQSSHEKLDSLADAARDMFNDLESELQQILRESDHRNLERIDGLAKGAAGKFAAVEGALQEYSSESTESSKKLLEEISGAMAACRSLQQQQSTSAANVESLLKFSRTTMEPQIKALAAGVELPIKRIEKELVSGNLRFTLLNDIASMAMVHMQLSPRAAAPLLSGWALDPESIARLVELVVRQRPKLVVECGSGVSTVWLAYALEKVGGRLVALEHLEEFAHATRRDLERHGLSGIAEVRSAPMEKYPLLDEERLWYARDAWADLADIEFLLVDGPPKSTGDLARYPALPLLAGVLAAKATVVLDDSNRKEEKEVLEQWRREFTGLGETFSIGPRTVAVPWSGAGSDDHA